MSVTPRRRCECAIGLIPIGRRLAAEQQRNRIDKDGPILNPFPFLDGFAMLQTNPGRLDAPKYKIDGYAAAYEKCPLNRVETLMGNADLTRVLNRIEPVQSGQ